MSIVVYMRWIIQSAQRDFFSFLLLWFQPHIRGTRPSYIGPKSLGLTALALNEYMCRHNLLATPSVLNRHVELHMLKASWKVSWANTYWMLCLALRGWGSIVQLNMTTFMSLRRPLFLLMANIWPRVDVRVGMSLGFCVVKWLICQ